VDKTLSFFDPETGIETPIDNAFAANISRWQAGGRSAYDKYQRKLYVLSGSNKLHTFDVAAQTEGEVDIDKNVAQIGISSNTGKLYALVHDNQVGSTPDLRLYEINTSTGATTRISTETLGQTLSNYIFVISDRDNSIWALIDSTMKEISMTNGTVVSSIPSANLSRIFAQGDVYISNDSSSTFTKNISDPIADFVKSGAGSLTITGANNSTGATKIKSGDLIINNSSGLGSGDIEIEGAELTAAKDLVISSKISITGSSTLEAESEKSVDIKGFF